ncbi:hypothetical protein LPJ56_003682 [Coemansia sp. RSA 2599]|nr:hypothetical protein LPJ75_003441 [Coemansia sp. RSA 2598]KAJ1819276.1 hypothetical protein LPJ56_003682 [Coemansia sp. RSA 2599]
MKLVGLCTIGALAATALAKLQIVLPNSHTQWQAGTPGSIKWKAIGGNLKGRLSIELMEGSDPANMQTVTTIAENIPAGSLETHWNVPKSFKNSNNYSIKIVDEDGEEYYGQYFKGAGSKTDAGKQPGKKGSSSKSQQQQQRQHGKNTDNGSKPNGSREDSKDDSMALKRPSDDSNAPLSGQAPSASLSGSVAAAACAVAAVAGALVSF